MQARFTTAVLFSVALIALGACGGGGNDEAVITDLEERVAAAEDARKAAEAARKKAEEEAAEADRKRKEAEQATEDVEEVEEEEAEEEEAEAEPRPQQPAPTLVANQRAENLLQALESGDVITALSPVDISVPTKGKLTFKQGNYSASSISAAGLRGARLTRSHGGTQTTVVYTDIELSRSLIKHYDPDAGASDVDFPLAADAFPSPNFLATDDDAVAITSSHGFRSTEPVDNNGDPVDPDAKPWTTHSGRLHGVSGMFQCTDTTCELDVTYDSTKKLATLTTTGTVSFKPSSRTASVSLCEGPAPQCAPKDMAYMAFGWWRSEPSGTGDYDFEVFVDSGATPLLDSLPSGEGTAEYNGTAVGMYVEQSELDTGAVVKRQGEFVADARLKATFAGTPGIEGTIDSFKTTPTGGSSAPTTAGRWSVKLNNDTDSTATIVRRGSESTGNWTRKFVPARTGETDQKPAAVVGRFQSEVPDVLRIVGAFGAHKQ